MKAPNWLGEVARKKWRELVKLKPSLASDETADTLALLAQAWENYFAAQKLVSSAGQISKSGDRWFVNPACAVLETERKAIVRLSKSLGLNPDGTAAAEESSPFQRLIDGNVEKR